MIKVTNVSFNKNPVKTGETVIISVSATEEIAVWQDVKSALWSEIRSITWDKVKRKIFGN